MKLKGTVVGKGERIQLLGMPLGLAAPAADAPLNFSVAPTIKSCMAGAEVRAEG